MKTTTFLFSAFAALSLAACTDTMNRGDSMSTTDDALSSGDCVIGGVDVKPNQTGSSPSDC